jgi:hypothetical protein
MVVGSNGAWEIATTELADGMYEMKVRSTNAVGGFTERAFGQKLVIDGTVPELMTSGLISGIAWNVNDPLQATLKDLDPGAKVAYAIVGKGAQGGNAVLGGVLDGTVKSQSLALKTLTQLGFAAPVNGDISQRYELEFRVSDRAGNVTTQTLKGMALNLPDLSDEALLLRDRENPMSLPPGGIADQLVPEMGSGVPISPGTNQGLYIGLNGEWGSSRPGTSSGGTALGGNGSSSIVWVKDSVYNPPIGSMGSNGELPRPPKPPMPGVPEELDYLPALELIFEVAVSNRQSAIVAGSDLHYFITPEPLQIASTGTNNLIAQDSPGEVIQRGLWELAAFVVGGAFALVIDGTGRIIGGIFKSSSGSDERTDEEKLTDEAIIEVLKGSIPTDGKGKPLSQGDAKRLRRKGKDVENYDKPEGDAETMREDIEQLANGTNTTVELRASDEGTVRLVDLPSGQQARTYPKANSTGDPTLEIELRPRTRSIKIRYKKGSNRGATIIVPVA